jgi:hypothetical protein
MLSVTSETYHETVSVTVNGQPFSWKEETSVFVVEPDHHEAQADLKERAVRDDDRLWHRLVLVGAGAVLLAVVWFW